MRAESLARQQAELLQSRGDLRGSTFRFKADLKKAGLAKPRANCIARIGFGLERIPKGSGTQEEGMTVDSVMAAGNLDTPGLKYNSEQARLHLPMLMVQRGDTVMSLNGHRQANQMIAELEKVTTPTGTRPMTLELERLIYDRLEAPTPRTPSPPPISRSRSHRSLAAQGCGASGISAGQTVRELRRTQSVPTSPCVATGRPPGGDTSGQRPPAARPQSAPARKKRAAAPGAAGGPSEAAFNSTLKTPWGRSLDRDWRQTVQGTVPVGKVSSQGWHRCGGRSATL